MGRHIAGVKSCIIQVSTTFAKRTGMACRFALVIYRDHCDGPNRFQIFNFMAAEELQVLLGTVVAEGGGDGPED